MSIGQTGLAGSAYARLFLVLGSLTGLGLAVTGLATGTRRDAPMVTLATLGIASLTLTLTDPRIAVAAATAGGLFGVWLTLAPGDDRIGATLGIRELRAVVVAGAMAIAATAWIGRDLTQLAAQPVVFGLVYVAFALAVAVRFGAIPFHLWAARLTDAAPETALPIITVLAPASLAVVALGWNASAIAPLLVDLEAERMVVLTVAVVSIVFAAMAALVHDDLEHVVGYSIIGDAGIVLLALAVLDPGGWAPARIWILAFVVTRSAFAAWAGGIRGAFRSGRIEDLRGWAIRSPILTAAFVLIVLAAVGLPGWLAFEARASLVSLAFDGPLAILVFVATFAPLAYYARLSRRRRGPVGSPGAGDRLAAPCRSAQPDRAARLGAFDVGRQPRLQRRDHRGIAGRAGVGDIGGRLRQRRGGGGDPARPPGPGRLVRASPARLRPAVLPAGPDDPLTTGRSGVTPPRHGVVIRTGFARSNQVERSSLPDCAERSRSRGPSRVRSNHAERPGRGGSGYSSGASTQRSISRS